MSTNYEAPHYATGSNLIKMNSARGNKYNYDLRFQVLKAASINMTSFLDTAPCNLVEVDRRFRRAYCLHHQGDE
jgi:hypothetical protein